jgi:hypothetical protein
MRRGWLELLEPIGIVAGAFCVGWVLAGQQGGAQSPPWGLWAVGPPVIAGAFWEPKLPSPLVVLFHTLVTRISLGLWALLTGWSVAGALSDFPWSVALHLVPLIVGLHVPLALTWDRWPSSQRRLLRHLGWLCFCLAALSALALVLMGGLFPRRFWPRMLPFVVGLPVIYRIVCFHDDRERVRRGLVLIAALLGVVVGWLMLTVAGVM